MSRARARALCHRLRQHVALHGPPQPAQVPDALSLWDLGLRPALRAAVLRAGLATVGDVRWRDDPALLVLPGVGVQGLAELRAACGSAPAR